MYSILFANTLSYACIPNLRANISIRFSMSLYLVWIIEIDKRTLPDFAIFIGKKMLETRLWGRSVSSSESCDTLMMTNLTLAYQLPGSCFDENGLFCLLQEQQTTEIPPASQRTWHSAVRQELCNQQPSLALLNNHNLTSRSVLTLRILLWICAGGVRSCIILEQMWLPLPGPQAFPASTRPTQRGAQDSPRPTPRGATEWRHIFQSSELLRERKGIWKWWVPGTPFERLWNKLILIEAICLAHTIIIYSTFEFSFLNCLV